MVTDIERVTLCRFYQARIKSSVGPASIAVLRGEDIDEHALVESPIIGMGRWCDGQQGRYCGGQGGQGGRVSRTPRGMQVYV
ncbi:hypothetical protein ASE48_16235 [Mycobacterium sp. Root265]|nr:hypothetical protein ASE48_16235 [Mycobacterium sp. Root265]